MIKDWLDKQENGKYVDRGTKKHLVIPLTEPVKFTKSGPAMKKNGIDPYVIGALIGDGCLTDSVKENYTALLSSSREDIEMRENFEKAGIDMSMARYDDRSNGVAYWIKNEKLEEALTLCKLNGCRSDNKFIPTCYKMGTVEERWSIIQGLMDTDGTVDKGGKTISFCTVSKQLAEDVQFVVSSLGGSAKMTTKQPFYRDGNGNKIEGKLAYNIYIRIKEPERLFRLKRKKERCTPFNGGVSEVARRIVGYRYIGKKDARCITVDSTRSLYLLQDFIVTHNSWVGLFEFLPYIFNPDVSGYGFRRYEDDIARGIWKSSKQVYKGFGTAADSYFEWKFLNGKGATFKCEHLQDPKKISDRFRGVEMAYILVEELAEHTRDNMNTLFDLLASNRSTAGVKPKCVCTCNPVGKSNKLRHFLEYYIDPETDTIIKERDGKIRYFYRYGEDITEIAWGDTWQEVYDHPSARPKIDRLCQDTGSNPQDFITSLAFIEGDFADNEILHVSDPKYMNRISARGGESTTNDIVGVWRDIDSGSGLVSADDVRAFYENTEQRDGVMRASCDVALTGDFFVIYAFDGHHVCDMEAWRGMLSDDVIPFIEHFLARNGVRKENFTYDSNGLGVWIKSDSRFQRSIPFNNRSAPSDIRLWNSLKSEAAEKFAQAFKRGDFSIDPALLNRKFTDQKGRTYTFAERFMHERRALKRRDNVSRFELIDKPQMKIEIGESPDFLEGMFMVMPLYERASRPIRRGFRMWTNM